MLFDYHVQWDGYEHYGASLKGLVSAALAGIDSGKDWCVVVEHKRERCVITTLKRLREYVASKSQIEPLSLQLQEKLMH